MKTTYIITEKQNLFSTREGVAVEATSLTSAKRIASKDQVFNGTVLTVESQSGALLAYKEAGKTWVTL